MKPGQMATYQADKSYPYYRDLDGRVVTVSHVDETREDFEHWIVDSDGNGSWAAERELISFSQSKSEGE